jgi:dihydrolipoamide dehydrogenase
MVVGDLATTVDVLVLGAGPGGYVAAIRASQLGREVVVVDPGPPGGVCLHQGCIPSKALLSAADRAWQLSHSTELGITAGEVQVDFEKMVSWKNSVAQRLSRGVSQLFKHHKIELVPGIGFFLAENELRIEAKYGTKRYLFDHCLIAVGGAPAPLPDLAFDGERVLTPSQALNTNELPASLTVIGTDYIAAELATIFVKLGVAVSLLIPDGLPWLQAFDPSAGRQVQQRLKKLGVKISPNVKDLIKATADSARIVVCNGLIPRTESLNLKDSAVLVDEDGFIRVNDRMQTSNPAVYAVGDVAGGLPLASLAFKQGKVAAESIAGRPAQFAPQAVPRMAWTDPQIAAVGLTADQAEAAGYDVVTGQFPLAANGRAITLNAAEGFVQIVAERQHEVLLGVTIVGAQAGSLIGEAALALEMGATLTDLAETIHVHPSLGETLPESAEAALGMAVNIK